MKILYITAGDSPDYMSDLLFHGLYSLFGSDVVDCNRIWYLWQRDPEVARGLYGRGFTFSGLLGADLADRTDVEGRIRAREFDLVVYGSIHRCRDHLELVNERYPSDRIAVVDGEDHPNCMALGLPYFKRELSSEDSGNFPISFGIPASKIAAEPFEAKTQFFGRVLPGELSTYTFYREADYYRDYARSYFGLTRKKAGWDCLRHYEILGQRCVPYFPDLADCPAGTMVEFPKALVLEANRLVQSFDASAYEDAVGRLFDHTRLHLTTEAVARRFLDKMAGLAA